LAAWPPARLDQAPIEQMMPVQSIICNPPQNTILGGKNATSITLKGVAWSGGGREIQRVDVSIDGGKTWTATELYKPIKQRWNHHWAWTQFYKTIELPEEIKTKLKRGENVRLDLVSKALNSDFNVQPERMEPYWNSRGVAINHWYHVNVSQQRWNANVMLLIFSMLSLSHSLYSSRLSWTIKERLDLSNVINQRWNLAETHQVEGNLQSHGACTVGRRIQNTMGHPILR
jgi:Mo-co oxidoreductase dimerisation domain